MQIRFAQSQPLTATRPWRADLAVAASPDLGARSAEAVSLSGAAPADEVDQLVAELVRKAPPDTLETIGQALRNYPVEALRRVRDYGTRIEIYATDQGDKLPLYAASLAKENALGGYNEGANVLALDRKNLSPFVLLHEFAHALDAALDHPSQTAEWKGAHKLASFTGQTVRDYARRNSAEYLAENVAAFLVADPQLDAWTRNDLDRGIDLGLGEIGYLRFHQDYSHDRLERRDPQGFALAEHLLAPGYLSQAPAAPPRPALNNQEYRQHLIDLKARLVASGQWPPR